MVFYIPWVRGGRLDVLTLEWTFERLLAHLVSCRREEVVLHTVL